MHPVSTLKSEYSLWERNLEPEIIPLLRSAVRENCSPH